MSNVEKTDIIEVEILQSDRLRMFRENGKDIARVIKGNDPEQQQVTELNLAPARLKVLRKLMENPERVVAKSAFGISQGSDGRYKSVDVHVCELRNALKRQANYSDDEAKNIIINVRCKGYELQGRKVTPSFS